MLAEDGSRALQHYSVRRELQSCEYVHYFCRQYSHTHRGYSARVAAWSMLKPSGFGVVFMTQVRIWNTVGVRVRIRLILVMSTMLDRDVKIQFKIYCMFSPWQEPHSPSCCSPKWAASRCRNYNLTWAMVRIQRVLHIKFIINVLLLSKTT